MAHINLVLAVKKALFALFKQRSVIDKNNISWTWGQNINGCLGDNTTSNRSSPISIVGGKQFSKLSMGFGDDHGLGIETSTGRLWGWGNNSFGELGNLANSTFTSSPVSVAGARSYSQVVAGEYNYSLAIEGSTGYIWAFGKNWDGRLGNNNTTDYSSPVSVAGGRSYTQIAAGGGGGDACSAALGSNGKVYCWGGNGFGQIGDNSTSTKSSPVQVYDGSGCPTSYSKIAAGYHCLGINGSDGHVWGWGSNQQGQLGINSGGAGNYRSTPVEVLGGRSYVQVVVWNVTSFALEGSTGAIWAWGSNSEGILGNGNDTHMSSPVSVLGGRSYSSISGNSALEASTGKIWSWGRNIEGNVGDNTTNSRSSPVAVARIFS